MNTPIPIIKTPERAAARAWLKTQPPFEPLDDQNLDCVSAMNAVIARARQLEAHAMGLA